MLPGTGVSSGTCWPPTLRERIFDVVYDAAGREVGYQEIFHDMPIPRERPTAKQIDELDMVLVWLSGLGVYCKVRKIPHVAKAVTLGMQHYPDGKRKYSWRKLAKQFPSRPSHEAVRKWYADGIQIITDAENLAQAVKI